MKKPTTLLILLLFALAAAVSGQKTDGPRDHLIAYNVLADGEKDDYEVFIMNPDGSGKRNLTNHADVAWTYHAWRDRIFFISDRGECKRCYYLYSMDPGGDGVRRVTDLRLEDSWMGSRRNGTELVVAGRIGDEVRYQLFIVDVKTGRHRQITDEPGALHRDPIFSPDGKRIVFAYKKDRQSRTEFDELWIMDADGTNRRQLTSYPKDDTTAKWHNYHAGPPRWNRKGDFITYQSKQNGKSSLYAVTPDGRKHWKLTDNELNEGWHDWTPDGKWLAVEMYDRDQTEFGIYLMNYETKEIRKLTDPKDSKFQQAPVFVLKRKK